MIWICSRYLSVVKQLKLQFASVVMVGDRPFGLSDFDYLSFPSTSGQLGTGWNVLISHREQSALTRWLVRFENLQSINRTSRLQNRYIYTVLVLGSVLPSWFHKQHFEALIHSLNLRLCIYIASEPMTEEAHNPKCPWTARALQRFDMHCLLFSYSGNVTKNHNKTRKTYHIWPLLNNLIKLAWYTNMKEQLLIRAELLLPCLRIGNSSDALLTIWCLHLQQSLSLRP